MCVQLPSTHWSRYHVTQSSTRCDTHFTKNDYERVYEPAGNRWMVGWFERLEKQKTRSNSFSSTDSGADTNAIRNVGYLPRLSLEIRQVPSSNSVTPSPLRSLRRCHFPLSHFLKYHRGRLDFPRANNCNLHSRPCSCSCSCTSIPLPLCLCAENFTTLDLRFSNIDDCTFNFFWQHFFVQVVPLEPPVALLTRLLTNGRHSRIQSTMRADM